MAEFNKSKNIAINRENIEHSAQKNINKKKTTTTQQSTLTAKCAPDKKNFTPVQATTLAEHKSNNFTDTENDEGASNSTFLPGVKPVLEMLRDTPQKVDLVYILKGRKDKNTVEIIDLCRDNSIRFKLVDSATIKNIYSGSCQGVIARLFAAGFIEFDELMERAKVSNLQIIIALDQVVDPGNVGTIARTLYALGGAGLLITKHQGAYLGDGAAKASAGALAKLPVCKVSNLSQALDKAEEAGFNIYGSGMSENSQSIFDFKPEFPAILVLGSEEDGIRHGVAKRCSALLNIPMKNNFDSINVAQAGAIILGFMSASAQK